jgi:SpoVK/Ycf46/Vps4 family AAA+-type ATPase
MMDDSNFNQLKAALEITPDNGALLELVVKTHLARNEPEDALKLVRRYMHSQPLTGSLQTMAAEVLLATGAPDEALALLTGDGAETLLLRARVLLALNRLDDGYHAYSAAISRNAALEDAGLAEKLRGKRREVPMRHGGAKLTVVSNDDTDRIELTRLMQPALERVSFADIGGLDDVKKTIHKKIILPYQKPRLFQRFKKRVGGGILMYGPPGCGKTLLARATAGECNAKFFSVSISDVLDMYIGESERKLHALFEKARESAPAVLFFDEVEALGGKRQNTRDSGSSKLVSQFLSEMDGFAQNNHGVLILAATNVPWSVDAAFRRPGRFDRVLFVPPPDQRARQAILDTMLAARPLAERIDTVYLSKLTSGFSGADLGELVETAVDEAIEASIAQESEQALTNAHLKQALTAVKPTTLECLTTARNYARYANEGGQYDDVLAFLDRHGKK